MNRRTLKKHCARAMRELIERHDYRRSDFRPSNGEETVDAPARMERRFVHNGFLQPGPLKGTQLLWSQTNYEHDEWDCALPSESLDQIMACSAELTHENGDAL